MTIEIISVEQYKLFFQGNNFIFMSPEFTELNKYKVDKIIYMLIKDSKPRFIACFGIKENKVFCPFSAPFGMIIPLKNDTSLECYFAMIKAIDAYMLQENYKYIQYTLPPAFYNDNAVNILIYALTSNGYLMKHIDINYHMDLKKMGVNNYIDLIHYNARKNLSISLKAGLRLDQCLRDEDKLMAYEIIRLNRESKGYPIRMSYEQVSNTIRIVDHEFFVVKKGDKPIAAAVVFHVNKDVAQVIYWGDIPGYSQDKPINYLSYQLILYYRQSGYRYLDIGPSSECGVPNIGLCNFKQSIGCDITCKFTFEKYIG